MFVTGLAMQTTSQTRDKGGLGGGGLCNFHQIIQHDSRIQFTNAHFSEKLFSAVFILFSLHFHQIYHDSRIDLLASRNRWMFQAFILCTAIVNMKTIAQNILFSSCSEDISKNTGVLIPHLIDPPSCPPHFPGPASPRIEIKRWWGETGEAGDTTLDQWWTLKQIEMSWASSTSDLYFLFIFLALLIPFYTKYVHW